MNYDMDIIFFGIRWEGKWSDIWGLMSLCWCSQCGSAAKSFHHHHALVTFREWASAAPHNGERERERERWMDCVSHSLSLV